MYFWTWFCVTLDLGGFAFAWVAGFGGLWLKLLFWFCALALAAAGGCYVNSVVVCAMHLCAL